VAVYVRNTSPRHWTFFEKKKKKEKEQGAVKLKNAHSLIAKTK